MESDENRKALVIEMGRRYLGIEAELKDFNEENNEKTELNNLSQNNLSSPKIQQNNEKSDDHHSYHDSDLVIDILNDELISQVREKIQGREALHQKF